MNLRERCKMQYLKMTGSVIVQRERVDDLTAFVVSEIGRAATSELEDTLPLCLYFSTEKDRAEFLALIHEAKPHMIAKHWP